jgi:hypothetical protein
MPTAPGPRALPDPRLRRAAGSRGARLEAAPAYAPIAPAAPHALHMPSHIFTRLGYWDESIETNCAVRRGGAGAGRGGAPDGLQGLRVPAAGSRLRRRRRGRPRRAEPRPRSTAGCSATTSRRCRRATRWNAGRVAEAAACAVPVECAAVRRGRDALRARHRRARSGPRCAQARERSRALAELHEQLERAATSVLGDGRVEAQRLAAEAWTVAHAATPRKRCAWRRAPPRWRRPSRSTRSRPARCCRPASCSATCCSSSAAPEEALAAYDATLEREPRRVAGAVRRGAWRRSAPASTIVAAARYRELLEVMETGGSDPPGEPAAARAFLAVQR